MNKIDRPLANLTKMRREKPKSVKSEMQMGRYKQIPWTSRESSETTLGTYPPINLKILKK
jgi:hypothetical protein